MFKKLLIVMVPAIAIGCSTPSQKLDRSTKVSDADPSYGYSSENPIHVGAFEVKTTRFNNNHRKYFSRLRGPNDERVEYKRLGSCCGIESKNFPYGKAPLDKYEVRYKGLKKPIIIHINMYDYEEPKAPRGLVLVN